MPSNILKVANIVELKGNDLIEMLDEFNKNLEEILSILYRHFTCGHTVCQSALKIDPPSASKIDPPQAVVFSV